MTSPADDVAAFLIAEGLGGEEPDDAWPVFVSREPESPDAAITVYDTGGDQDTNELDYRPTFQVRVRSASYPAAYEKAAAIRDALVIPNALTLGEVDYQGVFLVSDVSPIGRDDNDRHLLVMNFRAIRDRA